METINNTAAVEQVAADQAAVPTAVAAPKANFASALFTASDVSAAVAAAAAPATKSTPATPKAKAAAKTKSAAKPAAKAAPRGPLAYIVRGDGARKLFAHTAAWLELTGLIHGKSYPEAIVRELGGSALSYHMKQGNFAVSQGMVSLTQKGREKFLARQEGGHGSYAQEDMDHYMLMMMEGITDDRLVKSAGAIRKIA